MDHDILPELINHGHLAILSNGVTKLSAIKYLKEDQGTLDLTNLNNVCIMDINHDFNIIIGGYKDYIKNKCYINREDYINRKLHQFKKITSSEQSISHLPHLEFEP